MKPSSASFTHLSDFFSDRLERYGDLNAMTCLGQDMTYAQLDANSKALAAYLQGLGLKPGDRISIQLPNIMQYPVAAIAAIRAGLVVVNTNPLYTVHEMDHQFRDAGVRAVILLRDFADKMASVQADTGVEFVILTEIADFHPAPKRWFINGFLRLKNLFKRHKGLHAVHSFRAAVTRGATMPLTAPEQRDDLAVLQYTGGTTGVSKGAMLTHKNLLHNLEQVETALADAMRDRQEIIVAPLPLYHIFAFMMCFGLGVNSGARLLLIPDPRNINAFVKALRQVPFTFFVGLNTLFNALCRNRDFCALDFTRLTLTASGGMALTRDTAERWEQVTGCKVIEGYGLTEASPVVSINPVTAPRLGTVGKLLKDTEFKLKSGESEPDNSGRGELLIRGPQIMKGYWQRPDATAEVIDSDGWLHTGDVAVQDEDGYISIVDRIKDMIVVSGFNVYPNEVEDEISLHPDVVECAVVGVKDPDTVEAVKLFVVRSNPALSKEDIIEFARHNLTGYKVPRYIEFIDELPKSNVGKVLRRELRDR